MIHTKIWGPFEESDIGQAEPRTLELIITTPETIDELKNILNRALNCWPDAPVHWHELSDMLEYGKIQQDYTHQYKKLSPPDLNIPTPDCYSNSGHKYEWVNLGAGIKHCTTCGIKVDITHKFCVVPENFEANRKRIREQIEIASRVKQKQENNYG